MRVIAGELKGRQLKPVPGRTTRPTTDKVKEAVFQVLGPFFSGGAALDLFAGSGGLGIEALSRGIDSCIFIDSYPKAIHTIHENIKTVGKEDQTEVFRNEATRALNAMKKRGLQFDLIFLDPPYGKADYGKLLNLMIELELVKKDGIVYCEHDAKEKMPLENEGFSIMKQDVYGSTIGITIYQANLERGNRFG